MNRYSILAILVFAVAAVTAACSASAGDPTSPDPTATESTAPTATANPVETAVDPVGGIDTTATLAPGGDPTPTPVANRPTTTPSSGQTQPTPTATPLTTVEPSPINLPSRQVRFELQAPANTPPTDDVYVTLHSVDTVFTTAHVRMTNEGGGIYSADVAVPDGGVVRYSYDRWDEQGCCAASQVTRESLFTGDRIGYRLLLVEPETLVVRDVVPQWDDLEQEFEQVDISGVILDADTGEPLMDVDVTVAGVHVASDFDGSFTVPGIALGPQTLVAYTVKGEYKTVQLELNNVGSGGLDGLEIRMSRAQKVDVEFAVQLPPETPSESGIFLAGNLWQLGARLAARPNLPGEPSGIRMPEMTRDGDTATVVLSLYEGSYVEYFYTLGSDVSAEGFQHNRRYRGFIVGSDGQQSMQRVDRVEYWGNDGWPLVTLHVTVPSNTPHGVPVYLRNGPTYRMHQVSEFEYVTVIGSHPPGSTYSYSISLGDDHHGADGSPGLDESGNRSFVFPEVDAERSVEVTKWANLPDPGARNADGGLTVKFRLSVPMDTPDDAKIVINGDRPALGSSGTEMTRVPGNPFLYEADVTFGHDGQLRYRYTISGSGNDSAEMQVGTDYNGQEVNDYIVSWDGSPGAPRDGWISGIYTPDFWSEAFLPTSDSAFKAATEVNGEWVAISSVWSFGEILPEPFVESRPVRIWSVLTPIEDIRAQAAVARENGMKVFLAPQMNPEVLPNWQHETVSAGSREWWELWLEQAEAQWMWNAILGEEIGAELLMLPGYVFHVFPPIGFFEDLEYAPEFDLKVQELIGKVREVYSGKILISGSQTDYEFPGLADYVGVTTYDLGVPELPAESSFGEIEAYYAGRFEGHVDAVSERWGKPVMFYTIHAPAKAAEGDEHGQLFQAAAYEALFQQIAVRPHVIGAFTWAFDMVGASQFLTDGVRDRAAGAVLAKWYEILSGN